MVESGHMTKKNKKVNNEFTKFQTLIPIRLIICILKNS